MMKYDNAQKINIISLIIFLVLYFSYAYLISHKPVEIGQGDFWMHSGHVALFSENLQSPESNYDENSQVRIRNFSPYQLLLACIAKIPHVSVMNTMVIGGLMNLATLFCGIWLLGKTLGDSPWLPLGLLIATLFCIGKGFGWSGEINTTIIPAYASYPSFFCIALGFIGWYCASKYISEGKTKYLLFFMLIITLVFAIHQLIFLYLILFIALWIIPEKRTLRLKIVLACSVIFSVMISMAWPYFDPVELAWKVGTGQISGRPDNIFTENATEVYWEIRRRFTDPFSILHAIGTAILGIPLVFMLPRTYRLRLGLMLIITIGMWYLPYIGFTAIPTSGYRWAMAALLVMQFIIGVHFAYAASSISQWKKNTGMHNALIIFLILVLLFNVVNIRNNVYWKYYRYIPVLVNGEISDVAKWEKFSVRMKALGLNLDKKNLVSTRTESYAMPTFGLKPVTFSRKKSPLTLKLIRLYDSSTRLEERKQILKELNADYYVISNHKMDPQVKNELAMLGDEIMKESGISLYRLQ